MPVPDEGVAEPVLLLVDAYSLALDDVVLGARDDPRVLLAARARPELDSLVDCRGDVQHTRALDKWLELHDRREFLAGRPCLVRNHDRVHEFLGPGVLDLERLLVLESLRPKAAHNGHRVDCRQLAVCETEASTRGLGTELVLDRCPAKSGRVY